MFKLENRFKLQEKELGGEGQAAADTETEVETEVKTVSMEDYQKALDSIARLEGHTNTLLGEKKEADKKRKEAQELAAQQELEASKKANNLEEFERQITEQFSNKEKGYQSKIEQFTSKLIAQSQKASQADFVSDFADAGTASLALNQMIKVTLDDDLNPVREFRNLEGALITTDPKVFKEYLATNHASWLKGAQSSGGLNSVQPASTSGHNAPVTDKQKRIDEINKRLKAK
ncbi:hypothetical protein VP242E401_P0011 [Vibrio phage 242E40-1]|nr:hypothetical protein VP242E401_P0011 [Vibrio phage 242E40-1]